MSKYSYFKKGVSADPLVDRNFDCEYLYSIMYVEFLWQDQWTMKHFQMYIKGVQVYISFNDSEQLEHYHNIFS